MPNRLLRLLTMAAAAALPTAAGGCAPPAAQGTTVGASAPAASRPAPDAPADIRLLALEAAPALRPALLNVADTRVREKRLAEIIAGLKPKLAQARLAGGWDGPAAALADLQAAARVLREMAKEAMRAHDEFAAEGERYRRELARAPAALEQAADHYRGRAAEAHEVLLRDQYGRLADNCAAHVSLVREREAGFAQFLSEMSEAAAFTRRTQEFLTDFDAYATIVPGRGDPELRKAYRDSLAGYAKGFTAFVALHDRYSDGLRSRPLPDRPGDPPPARPPAGPPAEPSGGEPTQLVTFRAPLPPTPGLEAAGRFGEQYVRARLDAFARVPALNEQLRRYGCRPLPHDVQAEYDAAVRRTKFLESVRLCPVRAGDRVEAAGNPLTPGSYLPVLDDDARRLVGVVRVAGHPAGGSYPVVVVRGALRPGCLAALLPDSGAAPTADWAVARR